MAVRKEMVWGGIAAVLVGVLLLATHARSPDGSNAKPAADMDDRPPVAVVLGTAKQVDIAPMVWSPGEVISAEDSRIASELGGLVEHVAEVGTRVKTGQVIARLDGTTQALRVRQATESLEKIRSRLAHARKQEERYERLRQDQVISSSLRDQISNEREVHEHDLRIARAALDEARNVARHSLIRAPFGGVVVERLAQSGEYLVPGAPVVRLVNTENLQVRARAPLTLAAFLPSDVNVTLRAGAKETKQDLLSLVAVGDQASRQLELRVSATGLDLPVGSAVEVGVRNAEERKALMVPRDALIVRREGNHVVRITREGIAERIPVEVGPGEGDLVEVIGPLKAGDRVVIRGGERIEPGRKVKSAAAGASGAATPTKL